MNDTIQLWATIWKWVLIIGAGGFFLLMLYAIVAGAKDIKELFIYLGNAKDSDSDSDE